MTARPYKTPAEVPPLGLVVNVPRAEEHRGPRSRCAVCGSEKIGLYSWETVANTARTCGRSRGWLWWFLFGCSRRDPHIHQKCKCGHRWTCAPLEDA